MDAVLGIDVGKADFHCALLIDGRSRSNSFPNSQVGFDRLAVWLVNRKVETVHACLESTGGWSEELGTYHAGPRATRDADERARCQERLQFAEATFIPIPFDLHAVRVWPHRWRNYEHVSYSAQKMVGKGATRLPLRP